MTERAKRVATANAFIRAIARNGREFFRRGNAVSYFQLDARGRVWFVDAYTKRPIYTHTQPWREWRGFTEGGTLRRLVENLRDFIMGRAPLPLSQVAPSRTFTNGDIWGYGEEASRRVREECAALATPHEQQTEPSPTHEPSSSVPAAGRGA